jgi:hypothetical protein
MKRLFQCCAALLALSSLSGCLEVDQHPPWRNGEYAGKEDSRAQHVMFHGDKLAWSAAILNRNNKQNEYNRSNP